FLHFLEEMGDVDDCMALLAQPPDEREETFGIMLAEAAGRLVEDEHPAADLHQLPFGDAEVADRGSWVNVFAPELRQGVRRALVNLFPFQEWPCHWFH